MEKTAAEANRILICDDDASVREVLSTLLVESGYPCDCVGTAEAALERAVGGELPLVISDLKMPGKDGIWLLQQIQHLHQDIAVIMLTGVGDAEAAVDCLRRGAADYLLKPPKATDLVRAVERALARRRLELARKGYQKRLERRVREKTTELSKALREVEKSYTSTLYALVAALDAREHETSDHSQRVVRYTLAIADRLGVQDELRPEIARGALLHDIGKIGVPDAILLKPGPLTPKEWEEMRRHPQVGWSIIRAIPFLETPAEIVLSHQERWDGTGYPRGLRGEEICLGARIFALADTLDAMTTDRPYRKGTTFEAAQQEIRRCAGTQFDRECVEAFLSIPREEWDALRAARGQPL